jgi:hypothetical protein
MSQTTVQMAGVGLEHGTGTLLQTSLTNEQRGAKRSPAVRKAWAHCPLSGGWFSRSPMRGRQFSKSLCIGVLRFLDDLIHRALFDDAPRIHDRDAVAEFGREPEVVGDRMMAVPRSWLICFIRFMICAWMVTSSAVVGSSASSKRRDRRPAQWRSGCAAACRRRIDADRRRNGPSAMGCRPRS